MRIKRIKVKNFRAFYNEKIFEFDDSPFILLSAPNGIGKTSLIDAIEWAFTGRIGRLKDAFDARSTNSTERRKNTYGILKNKNSKPNENVSVELTIVHDNKEYTIKRTQKKDAIEPDEGTIEYSEPEFESIIKEYIKEDVFYAHHFCDINKSINLQAKKNEDMTKLFSEFIRSYDKEKQFAYNLELYSKDIKRKIDENSSKMQLIENEIKTNEEQLKEAVTEIIPYPSIKVYEQEETEISHFDNEQLDQQLNRVYMCAKIKACDLLEKEQRNKEIQNNIIVLEKIKKVLKEKSTYILKSYNYGGNAAIQLKIDELKETTSKYSNILEKITADNLSGYVDEILEINASSFTKENYKQVSDFIKEKNNLLIELQNEVDNLTKGNIIIDLMSSLISKKEELLDYRNTSKTTSAIVKCPICGSDEFGSIVDSDILLEAKRIVGSNRENIARKKSEIDKINGEIKKYNDELLRNAKAAIEPYLNTIIRSSKELENINNETKEFYDELKKLKNIKIFENRIDEHFIEELIIRLKGLILDLDEIKRVRSEYTDLLRITDFGFDEEEKTESIIKRLKTEIKPNLKIAENFEKDLLIKKVNSIKSFKGNRKYINLMEKNKNSNKKSKELFEEKNRLSGLITKTEIQIKKITDLISELEKNEFSSIGPTLRLIYKKLIRIENIKELLLKSEGNKLLILDENQKNIVNILSNGQISVFMLAYFFAGIISRENEIIKVYFIDDLTACMDDINMLSFLDLIKYQMKDYNKIEQLFFSSCDEKICKLLKYKLDGCGIKWCEINEKVFC